MANQIYSPFSYGIFGDGSSTSVSFDLSAVSSNGNYTIPSPPDSVYMQAGGFNGGPMPVPNVTSISISGYTVTVDFDAALTAFDVNTQDGFYVINFYLAWNA